MNFPIPDTMYIHIIRSIAQLCVGQQFIGNRNQKEILKQLD